MQMFSLHIMRVTFDSDHLLRGVMVEWSEWLGYGSESCQKVGLPSDDRKTLFDSPAVNEYLFRIRNG